MFQPLDGTNSPYTTFFNGLNWSRPQKTIQKNKTCINKWMNEWTVDFKKQIKTQTIVHVQKNAHPPNLN